jgi:replicative DNA helicase
MISQASGLGFHNLIHSSLSELGKEVVLKYLNKLKTFYQNNLIEICETKSSLQEIIFYAKNRINRYGLDLIIIDFLQLVHMSGSGQPVFLQISEIMKSLKQLALESNVAIIVLSQVSRGSEDRDNNLPQLKDLAFSSAIETIADIVAFIHRPNYFKDRKFQSSETNCAEHPCQLLVAKNRNGPIGTVKLSFNLSTGKFTNVQDDYDFSST